MIALEGRSLEAPRRRLAGDLAKKNAVAAEARVEAGAGIVGHTHTHAVAAGGTTDQVGNPWALERSAGGSSGGSAAAVAAGLVFGALGTDTAGSVRLPAALCGVSGFKGSYGAVSVEGVIPLGASLDHVGPLARTLEDCAILQAAMCGASIQVYPWSDPSGADSET